MSYLNEIPKKTHLGTEELQVTHCDSIITAEQRRLLVMIDGKKTVEKILKFEKLFGGASNIDALLAIGLIEFASNIDVYIPVSNTPTNSNPANGELLKDRVSKALAGLYGRSIAQDIDKIARKASPDQDPVKFLNLCKQKAMLMINPREVERIFLPFYNEFK